MPPAQHRKVAMTQPNPGDGNAAPQNDPTPAAPATGPAPAPTAPPTPPGFQPAGGDTAAEDDAAQQLLAAAVQADQQNQGDPNQLGDAGKRALAAERARAKAAEDAQKAQAKQLADLTKQLSDLKPAADIFAQLRKAAVPEEEKTDAEKLREELEQVRRETATERRQRWLLEIVQDHNLSREDAEWLRGDTREELEASAQKLAARLAATQPAPQPPVPENGQQQPADGQQPQATQPAPTPAANGPVPDPTQGARGPVDINAQIQDALANGDIKTSIALKRHLAAQSQSK